MCFAPFIQVEITGNIDLNSTFRSLNENTKLIAEGQRPSLSDIAHLVCFKEKQLVGYFFTACTYMQILHLPAGRP